MWVSLSSNPSLFEFKFTIIRTQMSARVCSQQLQGLTLCLRGDSECVRTLQARGKSLFLEGSGRFACGKLIVSKTRVRSRSTRSPLWCAEYTDSRDPPHDVRSCELDLVTVGGEDTDPSSEHVPQSIDAEDCNNEAYSCEWEHRSSRRWPIDWLLEQPGSRPSSSF